MKFISHHESLRGHLQSWAGENTLLVVDYYFWRLGSPIQRSLIGLLRSVLYQILKETPQLIDVAFPGREWICGASTFQFSLRSLRRALQIIFDSANSMKLRLFFLIDGLEEFDDRDEFDNTVANEHGLIDFLGDFKSPSTKLCVSSRPLPIFEKRLGNDAAQFLRMQDLTRADIAAYVRETLATDTAFRERANAANGGEYEELIKEIVSAANGVFLWVKIATQSLLRGITNDDRLSDLQRDIRSLPKELMGLYDHILSNIPRPTYSRYAARILFALMQNLDHNNDYFSFTPILAAFVYLDQSEHESLLGVSCSTLKSLAITHSQFRISINAYCQGLVDIHTGNNTHFLGEPNYELLNDVFFSRIEYSHRTVADFLTKDDIPIRIQHMAHGISRETLGHSLCEGHLAIIRTVIGVPEDSHWKVLIVKRQIRSFVMTGKGINQENILFDLYNKLENLITSNLWNEGNRHVNVHIRAYEELAARDPAKSHPWAPDVLGLLLYYGVPEKYVIKRLEERSSIWKAEDGGWPPLMWAVDYRHCGDSERVPRAEIVQTLLRQSEDPNFLGKAEELTPWQFFLAYCIRWIWFNRTVVDPNCRRDVPQRLRITIEAFLAHGADVAATCTLSFAQRGLWVILNTSSRREEARLAEEYGYTVRKHTFSAGSIICGISKGKWGIESEMLSGEAKRATHRRIEDVHEILAGINENCMDEIKQKKKDWEAQHTRRLIEKARC